MSSETKPAPQAPLDLSRWRNAPMILMVAGVTLIKNDQPSGDSNVASIKHTANIVAAPGTAVGDLEALDSNHDIFTDFDVLDDLTVQQDVTANP